VEGPPRKRPRPPTGLDPAERAPVTTTIDLEPIEVVRGENVADSRTGSTWGLGELVEALSDKHGQIDLEVNGLTLDWKGTPLGLELNGTVSVRVHLRDLSEDEKKAHRQRTLAKLRP
jgi:hypothetical protein